MNHPRRILLPLLLLCLGASTTRAALLVDDCESGGPNDRLGGAWTVFHDSSSSTHPGNGTFAFAEEGHASDHSAKLEYGMKAGAPAQYAGFQAPFPAKDLTAFEGVRFWARGAGTWACQVPTATTATGYNHFGSPFSVTGDWTLVELPFSSLTQSWGTRRAWDPTTVSGVQWTASGPPGTTGWIEVDDIEFYGKGEAVTKAPEANPIRPEPKVNQLGYGPGAPQEFTVTSGPDIHIGTTFLILDETGKQVFNGKIRGPLFDDQASTGEKVFRTDFGPIQTPGRYRVEAAGKTSAFFPVAQDPYRTLFTDALRCFTLIRCGAAVDDAATGIRHPACHLGDAKFRDDPAKSADLAGGWHNAGDFGKWTHEAAISCAWMMWLEELRAGKEPTRAPLLAEARWGLEWMLKMQRKDGSVWHKVDTEPNFCFGTSPDLDPYDRFAAGAGSLDAAVFIGATAQASRVFRAVDPAFADRCAQAAKRSWAWLESHPQVAQTDIYYKDPDPSQEKFWALGEMARLTGDKELAERYAQDARAVPLRPVSWMQPQFFGYLAHWTDPKVSAGERADGLSTLGAMCDADVAASKANGYGVALAPADYCWESNENLLHRTAVLLVADRLTGDEAYRDAALRQMDYLLGLNSLAFSFVAGEGDRSVKHSYHWTTAALGKLMPGWAAGGPNRYPEGADPLLTECQKRGTPPAKCYVDAGGPNGSWASNEGETSENAALVFCAGYLSKPWVRGHRYIRPR